MIKLFIIFITILFIIYIFWQRNKRLTDHNTGFYKKLIIIVIVLGGLFFLATSGKFILPQVFNIFKLFLPMITKLIGI